MTHTYTALSIGPIIRSLGEAKKTRELWGISYLFSHVMRRVIQELLDKQHITPADIVMPYRGEAVDDYIPQKNGTGMYPDRLIFRSTAADAARAAAGLQAAIDTVVWELAAAANHSDDHQRLAQALQWYQLQMPLPPDQGPVLALNPYLDTMELQQRIGYPWAEGKGLTHFIDDANGRHFYREAFGQVSHRGFPSIPEISSIDLRFPRDGQEAAPWQAAYQKLIDLLVPKPNPKQEAEAEDTFMQAIKSDDLLGPHFRSYHKYICIVQADGDSIGKVLEKIGGDLPKTQQFSKALFAFSEAAVDCIRAYQGTPVYAGGDDLLFFAPVVCDDGQKRRTIFDLVEAIDAAFQQHVLADPDFGQGDPKPSMSFGISISYYKHPLQEAIVSARDLLFDTAKSHRARQGEGKQDTQKNAVAFRLLKHSGRAIQAVLTKQGETYRQFQELLKQTGKIEDEFLSAIQYKLQLNAAVLEDVFADREHTATRLREFFIHNFDEAPHEVKHTFLDQVRELLVASFSEQAATHQTSTDSRQALDQALDQVYAALRFYQFIHQKDTRP
jgi:CRISPR-associated protein Cmr2